MRVLVCAGVLLLALGCDGPETTTLIVMLKTDLVPGAEFDAIRVRVTDPDEMPIDRVVDLRADYLSGSPIAELPGRIEQAIDIELSILRDGLPVYVQPSDITLVGGQQSVKIIVQRGCVTDPECPRAGGDPDATACLDGLCVEPSCATIDADRCGTPCVVDSACAATGSGCVVGRCDEGFCFDVVDDRACGVGERCDADRGCVLVESADAGVVGAPDAGSDGGPEMAVVTRGWSTGFEDGAFRPIGVAVTPAGSVYLTGNGRADFGGGPDRFTVRYAADGAHVWSVGYFSGVSNATGQAIALGPDGVPWAAYYYCSNGTLSIGGTLPTGRGLMLVGHAPANGAVAQRAWIARMSCSPQLAVGGLARDDLDRTYLAVRSTALETSVGGPVYPRVGPGDLFLARFSPTGGASLTRQLGGDVYASDVASVSTGAQVAVVGSFRALDLGEPTPVQSAGALDAFVLVVDERLGTRWSTVFGDAMNDRARAVAIADDGAVYVGAELGVATNLGTEIVGPGAIIIRFEPGGAVGWVMSLGGAETLIHSFGFDGASIVVAGEHLAAVDFGGAGMLASTGEREAFAASIAPDGTLRWSHALGQLTVSLRTVHAAAGPPGEWFIAATFEDGRIVQQLVESAR